MRTDHYIDAVRRRLHATRSRVMENQQVGPGYALVGVRSDNIALTPMNIFFVVVASELATGVMLRDFCRYADAYAKQAAGGGVGLVKAVATIAAVVADRSDHDARMFAGQKTQMGFGSTLRPVLVDLGGGAVVSRLESRFVGALAVDAVNSNVHRHFPSPAQAWAEIGGRPQPVPYQQHPPGPPHGGHPPRGGPHRPY